MPRIFCNAIVIFAVVVLAGVAQASSIIDISVPGATSTYLLGVSNNGVAVGFYNTPSATYGFEVLPNGTLVYPFADPSDTSSSTMFYGVNNAGTIVGQYGTFFRTSFILSGGSYSISSIPTCGTAGEFGISGINDSGTISGACGSYGYVQTNGNSPVLFSPPGSDIVLTGGVNDLGQVAGEYLVPGPGNPAGYGFIRNADGTYSILLYPGAYQTEATGINDEGILVGNWQVVSGGVFQAFYGTPGNLMPFLIPNAVSSEIFGINDSGEVVGNFVDSNSNEQAFISFVAVPEPSSIMLCAIGLAGLAILRLGKSRLSGD